MNARGTKYLLFGGVTTDRRVSTTCDGDTSSTTIRDTPFGQRFCDSAPPFRTTVKASAAYSFPKDIQLSGTFSAIPAANTVQANYTVTAAIAGRSFISSTAGATTQAVNLIETGSLYLDTPHRFDMRLGKKFRLNRNTIQGFMDIFNVFNIGTVTTVNQTFAATGTNLWMTPTSIVEGRFIRFGVQMSF